MNQPGIFDEIVQYFHSILKNLPDKRTGKNKYYQMSDAALSAFSVFFTQSPSFLAHQKSMAQKKGHNNAQSLFGVHQIPTDNHIRDLLDDVEPSVVFPVFYASIRYTLVAAFCSCRSQEITDSLVELLVQIIHRIYVSAERRVKTQLIEEFKRVDNKPRLLYEMARETLAHPEELVKDVVYPVVSPTTLEAVVKEYKSNGNIYEQRVYTVMRSSYLHHYRRMVPQLLSTLDFCSNNDVHRPVIKALELLKRYQDSNQRYHALGEELFIDGVLKNDWKDLIVEIESDGRERINRVN